MAFKTIESIFESDEQETARLAACPEGSMSHELSKLPVLHKTIDEHVLYELPSQTQSGHTIIGIPFEYNVISHARNPETGKYRRNNTFNFRIVYSTHPTYIAGGWDIAVPEEKLRRSKVVDVSRLLER